MFKYPHQVKEDVHSLILWLLLPPLPLLLPGSCFGRMRRSSCRSARGASTSGRGSSHQSSRRGHKPPLTPSSISNSCHKTALSSPSCLYNIAPKSPKEFPQVNLHLFKSILMRLCRYFTAKSATVQVRSLYSNPSDRISVLSSRCYCPSQVYLIQAQVYLIQLLCKST